jgi:hypothetical protein
MTDSSRRQTIRAWVVEHRDALPRTLAELVQFPMADRRAIRSAVSPEVRLGFWREHLESFLTTESQLTPDQQTCVRDVVDELPGIFLSEPAVGAERALRQTKRIGTLFTPEQARLIFWQLGPPEPPEGIAAPV